MERSGHTHEGLCRYMEQGLDEPVATWMDDKGSADWGWRVSEERERVCWAARYTSSFQTHQSAPVRPLPRAQGGPAWYLRPSEARRLPVFHVEAGSSCYGIFSVASFGRLQPGVGIKGSEQMKSEF